MPTKRWWGESGRSAVPGSAVGSAVLDVTCPVAEDAALRRSSVPVVYNTRFAFSFGWRGKGAEEYVRHRCYTRWNGMSLYGDEFSRLWCKRVLL